MVAYRNTLTVRLGRGCYLARPPRRASAAAWERLRTTHPELDGARVFEDAGGILQVELVWPMGPPDDRRRLVAQLAERRSVPLAAYADAGPPRSVTHYLVTAEAGVTVVAWAKLCECHDGLAATLGAFPDMQDVVAEAAGDALRELFPPEHYVGLGAAEALLDTARHLATVRPDAGPPEEDR